MKRLASRVQFSVAICWMWITTIVTLFGFCCKLIASRKFESIGNLAKDINKLKVWRDCPSLPSPDLYSKRNMIWGRANGAYHQGDWEQTKLLLLEADKIEDHAAVLAGFDSMPARLIGKNILGSIGHMSFGLALRARIQLLDDAIAPHYLMLGTDTANDQFMSYWKKYFNHLDCNPLACEGVEEALWPILESIQTVRTKKGNLTLNAAHNWYAREWERLKRPPLLTTAEEDLSRLQGVLAEWGISDRWLVTLHVRWDARKSNYGRNALVSDYLDAIRRVIQAGGAVVRLGSPDMPKLPPIEGLVDYAHHAERESWLDVALIANSRFMIATTSGPIGMAHCFGIPILLTNAPDLGKAVYHPKSLMIPKLVRHASGRLLTLSNMFRTGAAWMDSTPVPENVMDAREYSWADNSPESIVDGVEEMLEEAWETPFSDLDELWGEKLTSNGAEIGTRPSPRFIQQNASILFD